MLLYLFTVQMLALGSTYLIVRSRHVAASLTGAIFMSLTLASGYLVHSDEVGIWASWSRYISPQVSLGRLWNILSIFAIINKFEPWYIL